MFGYADKRQILKGVTIGENSVVGFKSVVFKNIEANKVAIGNPAVEIKDLKF
jgi:maltose O-acetyltransferase